MRGEKQTGKAATRKSVVANSLQAMNPDLARVAPESLQSLLQASHPDPFALLGAHAVAGGVVLRALLPGARQVVALDHDGKMLLELQPQDGSPLFVAALPARALPLRYHLHVHWDDGGETHFDDAYRFGALIEDLDVWLLAEGSHHRPYEWLGAHPVTVDGVAGTRFAVWAPNARRVSVVGGFNAWDGRRHMMRHRRECGVWEIFVPGIGEGELYKYEVLGADGVVRLKADPFAFRAELRPHTASVVQRLLPGLAIDESRRRANALDAPISIYEVHLGS